MTWNQTTLTGWGRGLNAEVLAARPERQGELAAVFAAENPRGVIAHGAGRSYGDAALNDGGRAVVTTRLDRILAFAPHSGQVVVEPGVTFRDLMAAFLPRGWLAPVTPGTAFTTVAGAVANDVHGKNHEMDGSFGCHVDWIELLIPSGERVRISPTERPAWFRATIGGVGLTGIMTRIAFRMMRVPSHAVQRSERRIGDLDAFLAAFETTKDAKYSVGWIDGLASGKALGRGILEIADPATAANADLERSRTSVPVDFPGFALNSLSVRAFNALYWRRVPVEGRASIAAYRQFLYPLDAIGGWNRIYGRRGFYQFQCVLPFDSGEAGLRTLLEAITSARAASFLAVLKRLGPGRAGHLSFPMPGFTLALDFPRNPGVESLLHRLEGITLDHGGRLYLAKDAAMSAAGFACMYPELPDFRAVLADIDPGGRMQSTMSRRLNIRG